MSATIESIRAEGSGVPGSPWQGFATGRWTDRIDVRDFIQANVTPYTSDAAFLAGPTERTRALWSRLTAMFPDERSPRHLRRRHPHPRVDHEPRPWLHRPGA